ncbi:hypothetical protein [Nannocystis pusilla]|uniref:hypothetical protein n=1 Tax=Nannocystis pusilla TaxID=889268 RepID=UPI003B7D0043
MGPEIPQCDPMAQDCPAGQKCVWYAAPGEMRRRDHARCIDVVGDRAPFAACSLPNGIWLDVSDDCGPESFCLEAFGVTDHGFCAPYPKPASQDCSDFPGTHYATENGSIFPHACLHFECNPQAPETCPAELQCLFYPAFLYGTNFCWQVPPGSCRSAAAATSIDAERASCASRPSTCPAAPRSAAAANGVTSRRRIAATRRRAVMISRCGRRSTRHSRRSALAWSRARSIHDSAEQVRARTPAPTARGCPSQPRAAR